MAKRCFLCGHEPSCGSAAVYDMYADRKLFLCHADDHSCYHRWTVYGERPEPYPSDTESTGDPRTEEEKRYQEDYLHGTVGRPWTPRWKSDA